MCTVGHPLLWACSLGPAPTPFTPCCWQVIAKGIVSQTARAWLDRCPAQQHCCPPAQASKHFTTDFEAADLLFVYDYCYTTWHTSVAFGGTNEDGSKPAQMVQIAYESLALSDLCAAHLSHLHAPACGGSKRLI